LTLVDDVAYLSEKTKKISTRFFRDVGVAQAATA
jgi:hypothetical protein